MLSNVETGHQLNQKPEFQSIRGKTVMIIGDSAGIGRATAALLAGYGARIFFAARTSAELSSALAAVEQEGGEWDGTVIDLNQAAQVSHLFDLARRRLGRIDVLINPPYVDGDDVQNLCMQEAIAHMQPGGRIINIDMPGSGAQVYPVSGRQVASSLRREASENGIKVTSIEPGSVDYRSLTSVARAYEAVDVAQCVYESLTQPYGMDVIFIPGQFHTPVL